MRLRNKLLFWWAAVVLLLVAGMAWPFLHTIHASFDRMSDSNFAGMRQSLHTLQSERLLRMRQAGAMVMNIPELRALIAEHNYEVSSENIASLQERLDSLAETIDVDFACVLDDRGTLIAQNAASPWPSLKDLSQFFANQPAALAVVRNVFQASGSTRATAQTGLWAYRGKLYQVVAMPLIFGDPNDPEESPSGAMLLATPWTDQLASDLGLSHNCEIGFLSSDSILACSLPPTVRPELLKSYKTGAWPMQTPFTLTVAGANYRAALDPLIDPSSGSAVAAMLILSNQSEEAAIRASMLRNLLITAVCGTLLAVLSSFVVTVPIVRPLHDLGEGVRRVAEGDLNSSIVVTRRDEIGELAAAFNDMVLQLRTRRQLQRLVEETQAASRAKSQFLANMSHELRTPLHGVLGITNLLLGTNLNERQRHYTQLVKTSTEVLTTLINDILDFSKIEAGKLELESVDFNLHAVAEDVVELMSGKAFHKGVEIACDIAPEVPVNVTGDPTRLRQILLNLVGNAIKFTEKGQIIVRITPEISPLIPSPGTPAFDSEAQARRGEGEGGGSNPTNAAIHFEILDTGIGIPPERLDRLFKSFSQVDASTTRKYGGTGLGLAISRQLAELMGGTIGVESQVGRGSTFWFNVKLTAGQNSPAPISEALKGMRILTLIPNLTIRDITTRRLTETGTAPISAADGDQATSILTTGSPSIQLILIDRDAKGISKLLSSTGIPCVLITSADDSLAGENQYPSGIAATIVKPIRRAQLLQAIAAAVGIDRPGKSVSDAPRESAQANNFRILVAEDNEINQIVAGDFLKSAGFDPIIVGDGRGAVNTAIAGGIDLILMDCQMPNMDGIEATRAIREHERKIAAAGNPAGPIPIIALTANVSGADRARCQEAGMDGYCSKPFKPRELLDVVWSFLSDKPPPRAAADNREDQAGVIDIGLLLERCSGSSTLALSILEKFERQSATILADIRQGLARQSAEQCAKLAHLLKGSAGMVGADAIRNAAAELEKLGRGGELGKVESALADLTQQVDECIQQLPNVRRQVSQNSSPASAKSGGGVA
jgi:signal transduction histidine kinase/CheY-like chemotaxis protein